MLIRTNKQQLQGGGRLLRNALHLAFHGIQHVAPWSWGESYEEGIVHRRYQTAGLYTYLRVSDPSSTAESQTCLVFASLGCDGLT